MWATCASPTCPMSPSSSASASTAASAPPASSARPCPATAYLVPSPPLPPHPPTPTRLGCQGTPSTSPLAWRVRASVWRAFFYFYPGHTATLCPIAAMKVQISQATKEMLEANGEGEFAFQFRGTIPVKVPRPTHPAQPLFTSTPRSGCRERGTCPRKTPLRRFTIAFTIGCV